MSEVSLEDAFLPGRRVRFRGRDWYLLEPVDLTRNPYRAADSEEIQLRIRMVTFRESLPVRPVRRKWTAAMGLRRPR